MNMFLNLRSITELDQFMINLKLSETRFAGSPLSRSESSLGCMVIPVEDKNPFVHAARAVLILTVMSVNRTTF